MQEEAMENSKY